MAVNPTLAAQWPFAFDQSMVDRIRRFDLGDPVTGGPTVINGVTGLELDNGNPTYRIQSDAIADAFDNPEGVFYFEMRLTSTPVGSDYLITLSDGAETDFINIRFVGSLTATGVIIVLSGFQVNIGGAPVPPQGSTFKVAFAWDEPGSRSEIWVNGVLTGQDNTFSLPAVVLNTLDLNTSSVTPGPVPAQLEEARIYNSFDGGGITDFLQILTTLDPGGFPEGVLPTPENPEDPGGVGDIPGGLGGEAGGGAAGAQLEREIRAANNALRRDLNNFVGTIDALAIKLNADAGVTDTDYPGTLPLNLQE